MNIFKIYIDNYSCLKDFTLEVDLNKNKGISPLVLVGLNGTGKSSLLEALSEYLNKAYLIEAGEKITMPNYSLHYQLNKAELIELSKNKVSTYMDGEYPAIYNLSEIKKDNETCLPDYLVVYSSGLNNSNLQFKFQQTNKYYEKKLKETAKIDSESSKIKSRKSLFIDYELNWFLFFSTYLFEKDEYLKLTKDDFGFTLDSIEEFAIEWIPPKWIDKSSLPYEMEEFISFLEKYTEKDTVGRVTVFTINDLNKFKESLEDILNIHTSRDLFKILEAFYLLDKEDKDCHFKSPWLEIRDNNMEEPIDYNRLSDGQHQLIEVLGILLLFKDTNSLILLDEPDTHLNPSLRSKFTHLINEAICSDKECNDENIRNPQIIISTHSPFIIGDTPKENIRHFKIEDGKTIAEEINWQTFGASYSLILSKIFGLHSGISEYAEKQIQELIDSGNIEEINKYIDDFGKSIKLRELYSKLEDLEEKNNNAD